MRARKQNGITGTTPQVESIQRTSEDLIAQMAEKSNDQMLEMFRQPGDWLPATLNIAREELQRRGVQPPEAAPAEIQKENASPAQKKKAPKLLFCISITLLSLSCLFWFFRFTSVYWGPLSPEAQGKESELLTNSLIKILIAPSLLAYCIKGKYEKLLAFSVVFALVTAVVAAIFIFG